MKKISPPLIFIAFISLTLVLNSCSKNKHLENREERLLWLQNLTDNLYHRFSETWDLKEGGLFLKVVTPDEDFLVTSNINQSFTDDTHFRVASISKTFTAAAIMLLHQEGKINIDDFIDANMLNSDLPYLPLTSDYTIPYKNNITIKQLLQHRSGVFDVTNQDIPETVAEPYAGKRYSTYIRETLGQNTHTFTFDEMIGLVSKLKLSNFEPGKTFQYSNIGYNILGKIIERASGMSYSNFITKRFIEPLQLRNTYSPYEGTDMEMRTPYLASFLNYASNDPAKNTSDDNMSIHVTEGNIVSTPNDITRWIKMLLKGKAGVSLQNVDLMKKMEIADAAHEVYGLGLTYNAGLGYGHDGAHLSYISTLRHNLENDVTILIVANFMYEGKTDEETNESFMDIAISLRETGKDAASVFLNK